MKRDAAIGKGLDMMALDAKRSIVACQSFLEPPELVQGYAAVIEHSGIAWPHGDCMLVIGQRLVVSREVAECDAAIGKRLDIVGLQANRPLKTLQRLVGSPHLMQRGTAIDESPGAIRI